MLPDRVSNPGPLTYESGALPIALRGPAFDTCLVQHPLMSEAKQDDLSRSSGYRILTNATVFTLFHDEGRFRMRNSQSLSIFVWRFI